MFKKDIFNKTKLKQFNSKIEIKIIGFIIKKM